MKHGGINHNVLWNFLGRGVTFGARGVIPINSAQALSLGNLDYLRSLSLWFRYFRGSISLRIPLMEPYPPSKCLEPILYPISTFGVVLYSQAKETRKIGLWSLALYVFSLFYSLRAYISSNIQKFISFHPQIYQFCFWSIYYEYWSLYGLLYSFWILIEILVQVWFQI